MAELSGPLSLTTFPTNDIPPVGEPSRIEFAGSGADGVSLRWTDGSPNEAGFRIYRSRVAGDVGDLVGTVAYNIDRFTDATAQAGVAYYYRVAAHNGFGELMQASLPLLVETPSVGGGYTGLYFRRDGVLYFAVDGPPRIERFDLNAGDYLDPVLLPGSASSLWVDQGGMIVSTPQHIVTFDGTFRAEFPVGRSFDQVFRQNGFVHARTSPDTYRSYFGGYTSFQTRNADAPLSAMAREFDPEILGIPVLSQSPSGSRLGRLDLLPPDFRTDLGPAVPGVPAGTGIFAFPDGKRVVTGSGTVFSLTRRAGVGQWVAGIDDIAFRGDVPIVRHGDELVVYSNLLGPVSRRTLADRPAKIAVGAAGLFLFHADPTHPHGLDLEVISFGDLDVPVPNAPLGIGAVRVGPGEPAEIEGGFLVLPLRMAAFPWNPLDRTWQPGIGLRDIPSVLGTYTSDQSLLTGHVDGLLDYSNSLEGNGNLRSFPDPIVALAALPQGVSLGGHGRADTETAFPQRGIAASFGERECGGRRPPRVPRGGVAYFRSSGEIVSLPFSESAFGSRTGVTLAAAVPSGCPWRSAARTPTIGSSSRRGDSRCRTRCPPERAFREGSATPSGATPLHRPLGGSGRKRAPGSARPRRRPHLGDGASGRAARHSRRAGRGRADRDACRGHPDGSPHRRRVAADRVRDGAARRPASGGRIRWLGPGHRPRGGLRGR